MIIWDAAKQAIEPYLMEAKLALALALAGFMVWQHYHIVSLKADNATMSAQVGPLKQAAKDANKHSETYRTELQQCENSKLAMKKANDEAIAQASKDSASAFASGEAYQKTLDSSPKGCDSILKATVCPALLDY